MLFYGEGTFEVSIFYLPYDLNFLSLLFMDTLEIFCLKDLISSLTLVVGAKETFGNWDVVLMDENDFDFAFII